MAYLSKLLPLAKIAAWFPMEDLPSGSGSPVGSLSDASGNSRSVSTGSNYPVTSANSLNSRPALYSDGTNNPLIYSGNFTASEIFLVAKYDGGADFGAGYRGLLSDRSMFALLVGDTGTTKFFNNTYSAFGTYIYRKSQIAYAENNQQAPFSKFELINFSLSSGWGLDGITMLQSKALTSQRWNGRIIEPMYFTSVLADAERAAVNLYFDLKYGLWKINSTALVFPTPAITGILYNRFWASNPDWDKATVSREYEDGGKSFSETSSNAPRHWEVAFDCVGATRAEANAQAEIFDAFDAQARRANTFNFTDKDGTTHTNVRIENYERAHNAHKSWLVHCKFRLVKFP